MCPILETRFPIFMFHPQPLSYLPTQVTEHSHPCVSICPEPSYSGWAWGGVSGRLCHGETPGVVRDSFFLRMLDDKEKKKTMLGGASDHK